MASASFRVAGSAKRHSYRPLTQICADRKSAEYHRSEKSTGDPSGQKTLSELGISKPESSDWQKLADIPDEEFEGKEHVFY
jgi:hypothetical protein